MQISIRRTHTKRFDKEASTMKRQKLWRWTVVVFAGALSAALLASSPARSGNPTSPNPNADGTGLYWGENDGVNYDKNHPSNSGGANGPSNVLLKTNNAIQMIPVTYPSGVASPGASSYFDDGNFFTLASGYTPRAGSSGSYTTNNLSKVYYDPDGPSLSGCTTGGRWLVATMATDSSSHPGILLASSTDNAASTTVSGNWYQAWIPLHTTGTGSGFGTAFSLGWNNNWIVVQVDNFYSTSSSTPGVVVINHDQFECGNSTGALTAITSGSLGASDYYQFDNKSGTHSNYDADFVGACVASAYQSSLVNDFNSSPVYLINGNTTNSGLHISSITDSLGAPAAQATAFATSGTISSWSAPPTSITQYNSTHNITVSPDSTHFVSCMTRGGLIWGAQTVGNGTGSTKVQWWSIGAASYNSYTAGNIYEQDTIAPTGYSVINPSIAADKNCGGSSQPFCDALIGFTLVSTSAGGNTTYMTSTYQLEPQDSLDYYEPNGYEVGTGPYQNCSASGGPVIPSGALSSTVVDGNAYPSDTTFFTAEQYAGVSGSSGCTPSTLYDWQVSWAQVPN